MEHIVGADEVALVVPEELLIYQSVVHSLCRVVYPLIQIQAVSSPDSSRYSLHKHMQAHNIIFQVYTHISGSS